MNDNLQYTTYTASEARTHLYSLIKSASSGFKAHEIHLRGHKPVILIGKEEIESWLETLDVMMNPQEVKAIHTAKKSAKTINHQQFLQAIGLTNEAAL